MESMLAEEQTDTQEGRGVAKSKYPSGTFDEAAFQIQLSLQQTSPSTAPAEKDERGGDQENAADGAPSQRPMESSVTAYEALVPSDPPTVPLFDVLGYHCVPHCGVYAQDDYEPALPFVFLSLPFELLQRSLAMAGGPVAVPYRLREELLGPAASSFPSSSSSFHVMVHPIPRMKECQHFMCDSRREINVITHAWTFPEVRFTPELEIETVVDMGLFGASGVEETHMNMQDSRFNGLPFNRMEQRAVIIHWQSFSPLNAQIRLSENLPWHSFFLVARHWATSRQCVSYHVIIESDEVYSRVHEGVAAMNTLGQLLDNLRSFGHGAEDVHQWNYDPFWVLTRLVEDCLGQAKQAPEPPATAGVEPQELPS